MLFGKLFGNQGEEDSYIWNVKWYNYVHLMAKFHSVEVVVILKPIVAFIRVK